MQYTIHSLKALMIFSAIAIPALGDDIFVQDISGEGTSPVVLAKANGHECRLVVDTCSRYTQLSRSFATIRKIASKSDNQVVKPRIDVGSLSFLPDSVRIIDLNAEGLDGILGMDCLVNFVVVLDFSGNRIEISKQTPKLTGDAKEVKLFLDEQGLPCVSCSMSPNATIDFRIGSNRMTTGTIASNLIDDFEKLAWLEVDDCTEVVNTRAGALELRRARVHHFSIGGFSQKNLVFGEFLSNCLGTHFLARFRVTIDFPRNRLFLEPSQLYDKPDTSDLYGIEIRKKPEGVVVTRIRKASPAELAGIKPGDVIKSINKVSLAQDTENKIRTGIRYFSFKGVSLLVLRSGEEHEIVLRDHW